MRSTVVSPMRNEGAFLVEWITWYRMLGFSDILVITNDCTDGSPDLLAAFARAGWVHHQDKAVPAGVPIYARNLAVAKRHPAVRQADWVFVCDADELLVIHAGAGKLSDLLAAPGKRFLGMSVNWRIFGTGGQTHWQDGLVHRQFTAAGSTRNTLSNWVKSLHRRPGWFKTLGDHGPGGLNLEQAGADWGAEGMCWITPEGEEIPTWQPGGPYLRSMPARLTSHHIAQVNHYVVRSVESFALKKGTLSASAGKDRYTDAYFERCNLADVQDTSALRYTAEFDRIYAEAMALPDVARLHHACCAAYAARLAALAGIPPEQDPRWRHHTALAR